MRNSSIGLVVGLAMGAAALAQTPQPSAAAKVTAAQPFDAHDLSGVWAKVRGSFQIVMTNPPPMTPEGKAKFDATKPGYGPRQIAPALGNDPVGSCDPLGMPRDLFLSVGIYKMEFVQTPSRVFQFFEWEHSWRQIWTDGRPLPKDPDPTWMGYSVGKWDGDTFIVDSLGFDDRTWLDHFGDPVSDAMRLQERWRRVDHDTLEFTMTITDPKMYTKPWTSEVKKLRLVPTDEFKELFCVPSEEQSFNKRIRDPAGGK